jgi:nucleotide-binding universal stress UspA family protein
MSATQSKRIVVGVDGSPSSVRALEWAIGQAELTGSVIDAVNAWHYPGNYGLPVADSADYAALAAETLDKAIAEARSAAPVSVAAAGSTEAPGVPSRDIGTPAEIRPLVIEGQPAQVLLDSAEGADLLVVGSRGHGGFSGALLGSVSQHVVHHAPCPVLVMRDRTA